jgi:hypothetical protein
MISFCLTYCLLLISLLKILASYPRVYNMNLKLIFFLVYDKKLDSRSCYITQVSAEYGSFQLLFIFLNYSNF